MARNQDKTKNDIYNYFKSNGYEPVLKSTNGKEVSVPEEAEVIEFQFKLDGESYGTAAISLDNEGQLKVFYSDDIRNSPSKSEHGEITWNKLIPALRQMTFGKTKSFELDDMDNLEYDMAKREHSKKLEEGYYPMGKKASYSDNIPECKIIIKHNRNIEEGEQRYRNIHQIFIENVLGERFLAPTTKPGLARVYARHIAEGGKVNDDKWNHITGLCEDYTKMAGFIRATRNGQFNEDTQRLVSAGTEHYMSLRESLHKLAGKRGYNNYFESWAPPLMESEGDEDLSEMFMNSSLDPRIESVIPILNRLNKTISENQEIKQVVELEEWADDIAEGIFSQDVERAFPGGKASGVKSHPMKPTVIKTNKPIGTRVSDIGKGGKEHNVRTDREWNKQKGVAEGLHPMVIDDVKTLATLNPVDRYSAYANIRSYFKDSPELSKLASDLMGGYYEADMLKGKYKTAAAKAKYDKLEPMHQAFIKQALGQEQGVAEGTDTDPVWNQYGHYSVQDLVQEFPNLSPKDAQTIVNFAEYGWSNMPNRQEYRNQVVQRIQQAMRGQQGVAEGDDSESPLLSALSSLSGHGVPGEGWNQEKLRAYDEAYTYDDNEGGFYTPEVTVGRKGNMYRVEYSGEIGMKHEAFNSLQDAIDFICEITGLEHGMAEGTIYDMGKEYGAPAPGKKPLPHGGSMPRRHDDDPDFMDPDQRRLRADQARVKKAQDEYHAKKNQGGLEEDIGPQQAAVGQLGATAKVNAGGTILGNPEKSQKGLRGKLVGGTNESTDPLQSILRLIK